MAQVTTDCALYEDHRWLYIHLPIRMVTQRSSEEVCNALWLERTSC